jgi:hypothetical protein
LFLWILLEDAHWSRAVDGLMPYVLAWGRDDYGSGQ